MHLLRTILRRTCYTAAALSTLLLLATLILWPVSYYRYVYAHYVTNGDAEYWIAADSGRADGGYLSSFSLVPGWQFAAGAPVWPHWSYLTWNTAEPQLGPSGRTFLCVGWVHSDWGASPTYGIMLVPFSYLAVLFTVLPLLAFRSLHRRRKANRIGLCPKCNYDLRAQHACAGGAVCPECGTPLAVKGS